MALDFAVDLQNDNTKAMLQADFVCMNNIQLYDILWFSNYKYAT